ncbi:hypothetical protein CDAR_268681 [Caerostris darwini]|uniref:Uncharacterized protein n=1 Tax=Caerostris darwini TaxID=1538125 RepID=A0AAV4X523_9ARAC|nr:hypothetical protein CDAR_268681 [Caerostris darwini]
MRGEALYRYPVSTTVSTTMDDPVSADRGKRISTPSGIRYRLVEIRSLDAGTVRTSSNEGYKLKIEPLIR